MVEVNGDRAIIQFLCNLPIPPQSIALDYSKDSFNNLEALIQHVKSHFSNLKKDGKLSDQIIQRASVSIGAYLGEVIKRHHGGIWVARSPVMKVLVINGQEFSPVLYVFQRLVKDSDHRLESYWADVYQKLYGEEKREQKPVLSEKPKEERVNSARNQNLLLAGIISIATLCFFGMIGATVYSNFRATNEFRAKLDSFIVEATKLNSMTEQGVNYDEFRAQLIEVKSAYTLIGDWPSSSEDEKQAFDKAIIGWNLTLDVWDVYIDDQYGFSYPENEELLKDTAEYLGRDRSKIDRFSAGLIPANDWIVELMGQASIHFEAGKAGIN